MDARQWIDYLNDSGSLFGCFPLECSISEFLYTLSNRLQELRRDHGELVITGLFYDEVSTSGVVVRIVVRPKDEKSMVGISINIFRQLIVLVVIGDDIFHPLAHMNMCVINGAEYVATTLRMFAQLQLGSVRLEMANVNASVI
ncbi:hypothetical protein HGA91_05585 [candidate division WWE3 bacterium]|nr:hypothetical protein [candidate division WWE3 bacterium]